MKKRKKKIIIAIVVLIIILLIVFNKNKNKEEELDYEIGKIEKQTLINSISSSGNIKTEESKNVTSVLVGSKITNVNVKVGDQVNVGDVLISFDAETLRKTASDLATSINTAKQQTDVGINSAERAVQDAENSKTTTLEQAEKVRNQAQSAYDQATQAKNSSLPGINATITSLQTEMATYVPIEQKYNSASDEVAKAQLAVNSAQENYNSVVARLTPTVSDPSLVGSLAEVFEANATLTAANTALTTSQTNLTNAKNAYDAISARYTAIQEQIASLSAQIATLSQTVEQTKAAYEQAVTNYNNTKSSLDSAILNAKDAVTNARLSSNTSTLSLEEQLTSINKQLEDANLKSTVSGTVTSVNIKKGDTYQGGTLLTIEGVETFIVEANVDEYDVSDIKEGMDVIIKTDSTREEELAGVVTFVAPSSIQATSASSAITGSVGATAGATSGASYLVKIEVLTQNDRLRLGMTSKLKIITAKSEDTLAVPYDAVNEKEDGKKYITIIHDDNSMEDIEVEIGLESGYYTEIKSDKISEGMQIKLPKVEGNTSLDDLLNSMGATGGIE